MGRILEPALKTLDECWSPVVTDLLDGLGRKTWKPRQVRRGLLEKPVTVMRHLVEGPAQRGKVLLWAVSHTSRPSTFDERGELGEGERYCWIVALSSESPTTFKIIGANTIENIPPDEKALGEALRQAAQAGPKHETFYGNKGPLSHTVVI